MSDEIICYCKNVNKKQIVNAIKEGAKNLKDIQKMTKACTGNKYKELNPKKKCCNEDIVDILREHNLTDIESSCCKCKGDCC
jgi:NAD(P)H-nitrite reductase large subunit